MEQHIQKLYEELNAEESVREFHHGTRKKFSSKDAGYTNANLLLFFNEVVLAKLDESISLR